MKISKMIFIHCLICYCQRMQKNFQPFRNIYKTEECVPLVKRVHLLACVLLLIHCIITGLMQLSPSPPPSPGRLFTLLTCLRILQFLKQATISGQVTLPFPWDVTFSAHVRWEWWPPGAGTSSVGEISSFLLIL